MGSGNSKAQSLKYEAKDWQEVERSALFEVMRSRRGQQANLYHFNLREEFETEEEVEIYHRRKSPANWVRVLGANLTSSGFGFCGSQENVFVLTEPIPVLLNSVSRLNKQQSAVVLYNALRGYSDVSRIIVPGAITDKMIGFNKSGQTKVWVNENFGMNHPGNHHSDALFDEQVLLSNLIAAVSPKLDLAGDFLSGVKNSRTIGNALNFIRANSGVTESVLENNQINVANYSGRTEVPVLRDTAPVQNVVAPQTSQSTFVQPQSYVQQPQQVYYQPPVGQQVIQSGYRNQTASFVQPSGPSTYVQPTQSTFVQPTLGYGNSASFQSGYQVPRYADSVGPKFSFTTAQ